MNIDSIKPHDKYEGVIEVTDLNGARLFYLMQDGVYLPGTPFIVSAYNDINHRVHLFLPFGGRTPILLKVDCRCADVPLH